MIESDERLADSFWKNLPASNWLL